MKAGRALVTGASRGIGKAIAGALLQEGWEVMGTCRSPRALAPGDRLPGVRYLPLDLGNEKTVGALVRAAGEIDLLVNNAGESPMGPAEEIPPAKLRGHFQVNFFSPVRLAQAFLPGMRRRRSGMIIFIGSIRSEVGTPFSAAYSAGKAAVRAFAECLRLEIAGTGVKVSVIIPWHVRTQLPQEVVIRRQSPYEIAVGSVKKRRDEMIRAAPPARIVADRVLRLLRSASPPPVVIVGKPVLSFLLRHVPRGLADGMSARTTGMPRG